MNYSTLRSLLTFLLLLINMAAVANSSSSHPYIVEPHVEVEGYAPAMELQLDTMIELFCLPGILVESIEDIPYQEPEFIPICPDGFVDFESFDEEVNLDGTLQIHRTWIAVDNCGNTGSCTQIFGILSDSTPPVIICPQDFTTECDDLGPWGVATATDNQPGVVSISSTQSSVFAPFPCIEVITIDWIATDVSSNTAHCTQTITREDTTSPVMSFTLNQVINCEDPIPPVVNPTASDNCDPGPLVNYIGEQTIDPDPCHTVLRRTWIATDWCGNSSESHQDITIQDITPPAFSTCPADYTVSIGAPWSYGTAVASDNCSAVSLTVSDVTAPSGCGLTHTRTSIATDACNNSSTCTQVITESNGAASPIAIVCPPDIIGLDCDLFDFTYGTATYTGGCEPVVITETIAPDFSGFPCLLTSVEWTATDALGNSAVCTQTIQVWDITPPTVQCAPDVIVECGTAWSFLPPTVSDNCTSVADMLVTFVDNVDASNPCQVRNYRTWTVRDECGNQTVCTHEVRVIDTQAPVISGAQDQVIECGTAWSFGTPVVTDNCSATSDIVMSFTDNFNLNDPCAEVYTRTWTYTDVCGNAASHTQTITIRDTQAPTVTCPLDFSVPCSATWSFDNPVAGDNCSLLPETFQDATNFFDICNKEYMRTWTWSDECSNVTTCTQTVTVQDLLPPSINNLPPDFTTDCSSSWSFGIPLTADDCTPSSGIGLTFTDQVDTSDPCAILHSRTWLATDFCGRTSTATQTVTVTDTQAPVFTLCPLDAATTCEFLDQLPLPTVADNCDPSPTITYVDVNLGDPCNYNIERTWIATDACGNSSTCIQFLQIIDAAAPVLNCPSGPILMYPPAGATGATANFSVTATDSCDPSPVISYSHAPGSFFPCGTTLVTVTAADACGNTSTCTFSVSIVCSITIGCPDLTPLPSFGTLLTLVEWDDPVVISGACSQVSYEYSIPPGSGFDVGDTEVTATALDTCGNTGQCSFIVTVLPDSTVSVHEDVWTELDIYPNPSDDLLHIAPGDRHKLQRISIVNLDGRQVYDERVTPGLQLHTVYLQGLTSGMYVLTLESERGEQVHRRILKE